MLMKVLGLFTLAVTTWTEGNENTWHAPLIDAKTAAGEGLSLHCRNPPYSKELLRWYKSGTKAELVDLSKRVLIDREGTLHFAYVDVSDAGQYKCGAQYKNTIFLGSPVNVTVAERRGDVYPSAPPSLASYSKITTARLGEDVKLECIFTGRPIPDVTWQHQGRVLTDHANRRNITAYLTIESVTVEDVGMYNCTAENEEGSSSAILHISIKPSSTSGIHTATLVFSLIIGIMVISALMFWLLRRTRRRKDRKQDVHQYDEIDITQIRDSKPEIYNEKKW
ncbi:contactin-5-like [Haliotis asinina]|uniref:contactin-5-like n=1 Tax=Haliotis asinina TaxID=109174 RepID=UPI0035320995